MEKQLLHYLEHLRGDIWKLLPMREAEMMGIDNHLGDYLETLVANVSGATTTYPILADQKQFLYVINNIQYLNKQPIRFKRWRQIVLNSTQSIDNLYVLYGGVKDVKGK